MPYCAAIFYIQYLSYWFLLIKNLSSQCWLVTAKIFTFPLLCEGYVSCGLIFQSLVIHLWQEELVTGGVKRSVFTLHSEGKKPQQQSCCCFHLCVCQRPAANWRWGSYGARWKENILNNTTNYVATFSLRVRRADLNIYYLHKHLVSQRVSSLFTKYVF